jgi:hypothetical protein
VLETCKAIKLMELKHIQVSVSVVSRSVNDVTFEAELLNQTTEDAISVTWLIWPRSDTDLKGTIGSIDLSRTKEKVTFTVPLKIFTVARWLALSISQPFKTNAAAAAILDPSARRDGIPVP